MQINLLVTGILLVISVIVEHSIESNIIEQIKHLTDITQRQTSKLTEVYGSSGSTSGNLGQIPNNLELFSPEHAQQLQKLLELGTFCTGITGVGFIGYGIVSKPKKRSSPLDTLKMRLAKGEISKEEFENMKDDVA